MTRWRSAAAWLLASGLALCSTLAQINHNPDKGVLLAGSMIATILCLQFDRFHRE